MNYWQIIEQIEIGHVYQHASYFKDLPEMYQEAIKEMEKEDIGKRLIVAMRRFKIAKDIEDIRSGNTTYLYCMPFIKEPTHIETLGGVDGKETIS